MLLCICADISVDELNAVEGTSTGYDLIGDDVGRVNYFSDGAPSVSTANIRVGKRIRGGQLGKNPYIRANAQSMNFGGFQSDSGNQRQVGGQIMISM